MRLRVTVRGRVQGVGFRYYVRRAAEALELGGWVRNNPDGTVEVDSTGPVADLNELLSRVSKGPMGARVDNVSVEWIPSVSSELPTGFIIR